MPITHASVLLILFRLLFPFNLARLQSSIWNWPLLMYILASCVSGLVHGDKNEWGFRDKSTPISGIQAFRHQCLAVASFGRRGRDVRRAPSWLPGPYWVQSIEVESGKRNHPHLHLNIKYFHAQLEMSIENSSSGYSIPDPSLSCLIYLHTHTHTHHGYKTHLIPIPIRVSGPQWVPIPN
jgi:hypothetical protein